MRSQGGKGRTFKEPARNRSSSKKRDSSKLDKARHGSRSMPVQSLQPTGNEVSALDLPVASYALTDVGAVTPLNLIRAGSSFFNRRGRRIEMKSIRISGILDAIATAVDGYARIMVVYDSQTNGALPTIADVLQSTDQAGTNTTTAFSGANLNTRDRFVILRDIRIQTPSQTFTAGVITNPGIQEQTKMQVNFDEYIRLNGLVTQFRADSAPAVIGDIATGGLFLITYGSLTTAAFQATLETRLRFHDR